jgi:hypothetical protein
LDLVFWASAEFGGPDGSINTQAEVDAFLDSLDPNDRSAIIDAWAGVMPSDQENIEEFSDMNEWLPDLDEDDPSVDDGDTTDPNPEPDPPSSSSYVETRTVTQSAEGDVISTREATTSTAEPQPLELCPHRGFNLRQRKTFRMVRKAPIREFSGPAIRYHVQINAKPRDHPFVAGSIVATWFRWPVTNEYRINRVPRPVPGKPAWYSHSNSHARPGTVFRWDARVIFQPDTVIRRVITLPNGQRVIEYWGATGNEGRCIA